MTEDKWLMRVEGGLAAHFKQPDNPSRPGVHWAIGLKQGERTYKVLVKALFTDEATAETRADREYQAQTVMQYLNDQLARGWRPEQEGDHTMLIGNPRQVS